LPSSLRGRPISGLKLCRIGPGRFAPCATMGSWNFATTSNGPHKANHGWKPLAGSPKKRGRDVAKIPRGKPSPASLSSSACNRPKKPTIRSRIGTFCCRGSRLYKTGTTLYSTKCAIRGFCELRPLTVLESPIRSVCVGHEGAPAFGRTWYLPGEWSGPIAWARRSGRAASKISSSSMLRLHCSKAMAGGCTLGNSVHPGTPEEGSGLRAIL
jgi:hypothetical protein